METSALRGAEARANRLYLEEFSKHLVAKLKAQSNQESDAARTAEALKSPEYLTHLEGYKEAVKRDEWFRWKKETALAEAEVFRTLESTRKYMMEIAK